MKCLPLVSALLLLLLFYSSPLTAQQRDYATSPYWIAMMDDPKTNYFEAVKAFETYWKNRPKPVEEKEVFANYEQKKNTTIRKTQREAKEYAFEYKKFLNWQRQVLPYVQADGSILSNEEKLRIFEKEKAARKKQ